MIFAVASSDFLRVTGHAGKARKFLVFEAGDGGPPRELRRVDLNRDQVFHNFKDDLAHSDHPLAGIDVLIAASCGPGFLTRMQQRGVAAVLTREDDPAMAVQDYLKDRLPPPRPRPITGLFCRLRDAFSDHG